MKFRIQVLRVADDGAERMKRTNCILVICLLPALLCSTGLGHGVLLFEQFWIRVVRSDWNRMRRTTILATT